MPNPDPATTTRGPAHRPVLRLACPHCGSTRLSSVEQVTATGRCDAITLDADGTAKFHHTGWTDVDWNQTTTIGVQCERCTHTLREGPLDEILARLARRPVHSRRAT